MKEERKKENRAPDRVGYSHPRSIHRSPRVENVMAREPWVGMVHTKFCSHIFRFSRLKIWPPGSESFYYLQSDGSRSLDVRRSSESDASNRKMCFGASLWLICFMFDRVDGELQTDPNQRTSVVSSVFSNDPFESQHEIAPSETFGQEKENLTDLHVSTEFCSRNRRQRKFFVGYYAVHEPPFFHQ